MILNRLSVSVASCQLQISVARSSCQLGKVAARAAYFGLRSVVEKIFIAGISHFPFLPVSTNLLSKMHYYDRQFHFSWQLTLTMGA